MKVIARIHLRRDKYKPTTYADKVIVNYDIFILNYVTSSYKMGIYDYQRGDSI